MYLARKPTPPKYPSDWTDEQKQIAASVETHLARRLSSLPYKPSKAITPALIERLYGLVRAGLNNKQVAAALGIDDGNLCKWLKRGRAGDQGYVQFLQAYEMARAELIEELHTNILAAAKKDWRAAMAMLKILEPDTYQSPETRPQTAIQINTGDIDVKSLSDSDLAGRIRQLSASLLPEGTKNDGR